MSNQVLLTLLIVSLVLFLGVSFMYVKNMDKISGYKELAIEVKDLKNNHAGEIGDKNSTVNLLREQLGAATNLAGDTKLLKLELERTGNSLDDYKDIVKKLEARAQKLNDDLILANKETAAQRSQVNKLEVKLAAVENQPLAQDSEEVDALKMQILELSEQVANLEMVGARQAERIREITYELEYAHDQLAKSKADLKNAIPEIAQPEKKPEPEKTRPEDPPANSPTPDLVNPAGTPDIIVDIVELDEDYVVLEAGKDSGLVEGVILFLYQGKNLTGVVEVSMVYESMTMTKILKDSCPEGTTISKTDKAHTVYLALK
ncbi:hypothetical protein ACFL54_00940 [Planctomycetota bacterium]